MAKIKITGGSLKGRVFSVLENPHSRFTSSKVREAIFAMVGDVTGLKVLDLFAGSGSFTVEALSRGARHATYVEKNGGMAGIIGKNLVYLGLDKDCLVLKMDVRYAIPFLYKRGYEYDIIFMDPPYEKGLIVETTAILRKYAIFHEDSLLLLEYSKRESDQDTATWGWRDIGIKRYGDTVVRIMRVQKSAI